MYFFIFRTTMSLSLFRSLSRRSRSFLECKTDLQGCRTDRRTQLDDDDGAAKSSPRIAFNSAAVGVLASSRFFLASAAAFLNDSTCPCSFVFGFLWTFSGIFFGLVNGFLRNEPSGGSACPVSISDSDSSELSSSSSCRFCGGIMPNIFCAHCITSSSSVSVSELSLPESLSSDVRGLLFGATSSAWTTISLPGLGSDDIVTLSDVSIGE
mmetsp:Transcript_25510/g.43385  ORF Transcript_25510/g.43385 Transcript_25510/m.43385 type:complete len:210 (-) Transcript_25510:156-785(-)